MVSDKDSEGSIFILDLIKYKALLSLPY